MKYSVFKSRRQNGWTLREALGLDERENSGTKIVVEGIEYKSISLAANAYGLHPSAVAIKLRKGYSPEQALGLIPIEVLQRDDKALLWMFENEYRCNASEMLADFHQRKRTSVCTEKRLLKLFSRWGVWPYVDDRLVMPLVAEMAMLTGLNVEALKELEVDSYQPKHLLTGQAVITYRKRRSSSRTRSEAKELHLQMLEVEEMYVDHSVAERVYKLFMLTLGVTAQIRNAAPLEISRRLFIFEDIERSRRECEKIIVPIEPSGKAGHWYKRFCNEEGLYDFFGPEFSFNISRCRPTLVTNMVLAGADLFQVQVALGHKNIGTTLGYADEQGLRELFNKTVSEALKSISRRSIELLQNRPSEGISNTKCKNRDKSVFHETLSGCGCVDPYQPSENVKKVTGFQEGSVCKYWNMCLRCDRSVVTEHSLPKLILYRSRVMTALESDSPAIRTRRILYSDAIKLIDEILKPDEIFPVGVIDDARYISATMDDVLIDQLIYQGI